MQTLKMSYETVSANKEVTNSFKAILFLYLNKVITLCSVVIKLGCFQKEHLMEYSYAKSEKNKSFKIVREYLAFLLDVTAAGGSNLKSV